MQEQGSSIVGTHESAIANTLSPFCIHRMNRYLEKDQIFLGGRHQEERRFLSPGLHHIKSVSSHWEILRNETYVDLDRYSTTKV